MKRVKGDILNAQHGIITHQCNCQLVMGAGLAKQIRAKYPYVYSEYRAMKGYEPHRRLGLCQIVEVKRKELYVANLFGQWHYRPRGIVHTDYGALAMAFASLRGWHIENCHEDFPIFVPYKIGCGLAGGNWETVERIISEQIPKAIIVRKS